MKKNYQQPSTKVVNVKAASMLSTSVNGIGGNTTLRYGGGNSGVARAREYNGWGDDWDEEW